MSDPGTTYRTREEIQQMRSSHDPINGLRQLLEKITSEEELKQIDKDARQHVDVEFAEAEKTPVPDPTPKILFEDIYVQGSEPTWLRGRTPDETHYY
jgi:pyruvate dehydrogenase E1 component alpha subunit